MHLIVQLQNTLSNDRTEGDKSTTLEIFNTLSVVNKIRQKIVSIQNI